jgi:hypothetical protein
MDDGATGRENDFSLFLSRPVAPPYFYFNTPTFKCELIRAER